VLQALSHCGFLSEKLSVTGFREMLMWLRVFFVRGHPPQLPPPPNWSEVLRRPYSSIVLGSFLPMKHTGRGRTTATAAAAAQHSTRATGGWRVGRGLGVRRAVVAVLTGFRRAEPPHFHPTKKNIIFKSHFFGRIDHRCSVVFGLFHGLYVKCGW
jgi:hypothetical protein